MTRYYTIKPIHERTNSNEFHSKTEPLTEFFSYFVPCFFWLCPVPASYHRPHILHGKSADPNTWQPDGHPHGLEQQRGGKIFGIALSKRGIQPLWLEIDNHNNDTYVLIPRNMDPDYFSAEEASYRAHYKQTRQFFEAGLLAVIFFPLLSWFRSIFSRSATRTKK